MAKILNYSRCYNEKKNDDEKDGANQKNDDILIDMTSYLRKYDVKIRVIYTSL